MTADDRTAALERRVAALEAAVESLQGNGSANTPAEGDGDAETFWALRGLRDRLPEGAGAVLFTGRVQAPDGPIEWQETHPDSRLLDEGWEEAGTALAALASPVRMLLLREVLRSPGSSSTAAELAELEGLGTSGQVYHHLRQLTAAGWLRSASRGRYAVPPERVVPLLAIVAAARR